MKFNYVILAWMACLLSGCTFGSDPQPINAPPQVSITGPATVASGESATFTSQISGGSGPYAVSFDFGTLAQPVQQIVAGPTASATVTLENAGFVDQDAVLSVAVVDATANQTTAQFNFVLEGRPIQQPQITGIDLVDDGDLLRRTLTVQASGTPGMQATLVLNLPDGVSAEPAGSNFMFDAAGLVVREFVLQRDGFDVGTANVEVELSTAVPNPARLTEQVQVEFADIALAPDTLYAIPLDTQVRVGEPVRIVAAMGDPSFPFLYMVGVSVCAPEASGFDQDTFHFNIGDVGGDADDPDGVWAAMGIEDFMLRPDDIWTPRTTDDGRIAWDFNVTPLGGTAADTIEGALFNFVASFDTPGTWPLTFQQFDVVPRTYYQDANQAPDYFWGDISNVHAGIPNSVVVLP